MLLDGEDNIVDRENVIQEKNHIYKIKIISPFPNLNKIKKLSVKYQ